MNTKKPQAILDLERVYNIEIPDLSQQKKIWKNIERYFKQDSSGAILELRLQNCEMDSMAWVANFLSLSFLDLSSNQISKIEGLEGLSSLKILHLGGNQINKIENIEQLSDLFSLDLNGNPIDNIGNLGQLTNLNSLNLANNQIDKIENIEQLSALDWLYLANNQIGKIENLELLNKLKKLTINDNPFVAPSGLILPSFENHLPVIKAFIEKEEQEKIPYTPFCKVMLVGNHASGKSTFLREYDNMYKNKGSTHVLSVHRTENPQAIFYDFGGQDYYHGIYRAFFTTQSLNLLFWEAENDKNFVSNDTNGLKTLNFDRTYWLGQIAYASDLHISTMREQVPNKQPSIMDETIVIQTHADKGKGKQQTLGRMADCGVLEEIYISLVSKTASAQHARKYLIERVREVIRNKNKEIRITKKDKKLLDTLHKLADENQHNPISLEKLASILNEQHETPYIPYTKEYLQTELHQLSQRGEVLYYHSNERLNNYVWLNPSAFVRMIHTDILRKNILHKNIIKRGIVDKKKFEELCATNNSCIGSINPTLQLLLEELIVYEDETCYVIPGYLPLHADDEAYKWLTLGFDSPNFILKFERFIPFGLINQIMAYYGREKGALKRYWRDQVIFTAGRDIDTLQGEELGGKSADYLIWIRLDFTNLSISVFFKELRDRSSGGQNRRSSEDLRRKEATILNDILDMYWNNIPSKAQMEERETAQKRNERRKWYRKEKPIQDLYLSYTAAEKDLQMPPHYIHLGTLDNEEKTRAKIAAYPLKDDGTIDKEQVREISARPYKHLSINTELSKVKRVFISYSKHDQRELEQCLLFFKPLERERYIEIYYDKLTEFDSPIHAEINRQIIEADCIIALVSQNYLNTEYILDHELPVIEHYKKCSFPYRSSLVLFMMCKK